MSRKSFVDYFFHDRGDSRAQTIHESIDWWKNEFLAEWPKSRNFWKTKRYFRNGIPPSLRGRVWSVVIGNELNISRDLFEIMNARASESRRVYLSRAASLDRHYTAVNEAIALMEEKSGSVTAEDASTKQENAGQPIKSRKSSDILSPFLDSELFLGKEDSLRVIYADLPRTFPELMFFHVDGPMYEPLQHVLECYSCFRPDIGYCQGMSFIAAMFVLNMESDYDSFVAFSNLMNKQFLFTFFRFDIHLMGKHLNLFSNLMSEHVPAVQKHFACMSVGIEPDMFLYDWWLTLFTRVLPLDIAARVWDNYFFEMSLSSSSSGSDSRESMASCSLFLFKVALSLLKLNNDELVSLPMEDALKLLKRMPDTLDAEKLFDTLDEIDLTEKEFSLMLKSFENN